jgi:uncharacterized membrane protein YkoI
MRLLSTLTLVAALSFASGSLAAQEPTRNVPDSLAAKAKISEDSARAVALKRVPGTVEGVALAKSGKTRLVYTFKVQRNGRTGLTDVLVNANTGKVIAVRRESTKGRSTTRRSS